MKKTFNRITEAEKKLNSVSSLGDRPNISNAYGKGGLSASELKAWFDKLSELLITRLNTVTDGLSSEGDKYVGLTTGGSLHDFVTKVGDATLAAELKAYLNEAEEAAKNPVALQSVIYAIQRRISDVETDTAIARLENGKLPVANISDEIAVLPDTVAEMKSVDDVLKKSIDETNAGISDCKADIDTHNTEIAALKEEDLNIRRRVSEVDSNALARSGGINSRLIAFQNDATPKITKNTADIAALKSDKLDKTGGVITGNLTIEGDIIQNGAAYETQAEVVRSKNDLIVTRDGAVTGLAEGAYTGIKAEKYDGTNDGMLVFDQGGTARVGDVGELQPLATRDEDSALVDGKYLYWDAAAKKLKAASKADADIVALKTETENIRKDYAAADTSINEAVTSLRTQTTNSFSEANNAIGALRNSVNFFDGEIQGLDSKVDSYGASLNEAVGRVMKNEQAIAGHTSDIATINSRLANIGQGGGSGEGGGTASAGFTLFDGEMELDPANDAQWDCLGVVPSDFPETSGGDAVVADVPHDKRTHKLIVLPHADIKSSGYTTLEILFEWRKTVVQPADSYNPEITYELKIPAVCRMSLNEELFGAMGIGGEAVRSMFGETITDADFAAGIACYQKMSVDNDCRETFYRRTNIIPIAPNISNPYGEICTFGLSFGTLNGIKSKLKPETFKEFEKIIFGKLNNSVAPPEACSFLLLNRTFIAPKLQQTRYENEGFDSFTAESKKRVHWQPEAITGAPDYETKVHGYKTFMEFGYENRQKCFDIDGEGSWIGATPGVDAEWGLKCLKGLHWDAEFKASYPPFVIKKIRLV